MRATTKEQQAAAPGCADWRCAAWLGVLAWAAILGAFHETFWSMVSIWWRSETFAHGFLIFPITAWLIWDKRRRLVQLRPRPEFWVIPLMLLSGFGWLLANMVDVQVVQQLALIILLILAAWLILGTGVVRTLMFPLGFMFFAVPMGEGLIGPMMDFTADFTVSMLKLTGIPVYREGTFFSIPSGDWSVVEGCSGVRYLIASITLGCLYAYLTYRSLLRRLIFIGFAIALPIIANGLRAYMIVMIAHLSDMKLALGVDHLIYGWVFFGIVIMIMFLVGSIWRQTDEHTADSVSPRRPSADTATDRAGAGRFAFAALAGVVSASLWPGLASSIHHGPASAGGQALSPSSGAGGWALVETAIWDWRPRIVGADDEFHRFYVADSDPVELYIGLYRSQRQGAELINSSNVMVVQKNPVWRNQGQETRRVELRQREVKIIQTKIASMATRLLVWHWYRIGERYTSNPYVAKLLEIWGRLSGARRDAAMIVLSTSYDTDPEEGAERLRNYTNAMLGEIEGVLDRAAGEG